jgi:hypothetical protein
MEVIDQGAGLRYSRAETAGGVMRRWILTGLAAVAVFSATAFAQATLETLMTHSVSTSVATHAGTALGRATNALAGKVAQQTSTTTSHASSPQTSSTRRRAGAAATRRTQTETASTAWAGDTPLPGNGSLILSIQGGERHSTACRAPAKTGEAKPTGETVSQNCAVAAPQAVDHPSVINLPAPQ